MRSTLFAGLILSAACGEGGTDPLVPDGGSDKPECAPCAAQLRSETDPCGAMLDACTDDPMLSVEAQIACFQQDGRCYADALLRSSTCHRECGDLPQANVESCTAGCFTDRANCAEQALRRADACFETCGDPNQCALCNQLGQSDFDRCDQTAVDCAEACKRTHRDG